MLLFVQAWNCPQEPCATRHAISPRSAISWAPTTPLFTPACMFFCASPTPDSSLLCACFHARPFSKLTYVDSFIPHLRECSKIVPRHAHTMLHLAEKTILGETEKGLPPLSPLGVSTRYRSIHRRIARVLAPSFLAPNSSASRDVERPTDFLDGMRGYAAFAVFCYHFFKPTHPGGHMGYGGNNGVSDYYPTQLPILRLIFSGHVSVSLFFVISGFSISLKPLKQARSGSYASFLETMTSATFRRTCRLYLPCVVMLWITFIMASLGAFDFSFKLKRHWPFLGNPLRIPNARHSVWVKFQDLLSDIYIWSDPLSQERANIHYGTQLWTIPVELNCSFISFLALIGLAKVRPAMRMGITAAIAAYFQLKHHPEATLFLAGNVLAELYLVRQERIKTNPSQQLETRRQKIQSCVLFVISLFLVSYPRRRARTGTFSAPLYTFATLLFNDDLDKVNFYITFGCVMMVWCVSRSRFLQSMFSTPVARYLGKTSFALYCVHQALINWFGYRSMLYFWTLTGKQTTGQYELGLVLAWIFQTIVTIWAADIFWRFIDLPTVRITKRLEELCVVRS
jgi:peptidoglycan/LPS O-acetylase OafA/YrhL